MFTIGFTDLTFIHSYYSQNVCPSCDVNVRKSEIRKHRHKTAPIITRMKIKNNFIPAGLESDEEEYDEFGDFIEKRTHFVEQRAEDFLMTLQNACVANNVPEIKRALELGSCDINGYLNGSWTPLMNAAFNGSLDAVTYLLQNGADPLLQYDCHNVVMCVCNCKNNSNENDLFHCLKLFLSFDGFDINSKDRTGMSALMYACSSGSLKVVEYLIDHGADIEMKDNQNGETALFFAVRNNNISIVKCLLSHGARKDVCDKRGENVLRIAENKNMVEILNLLNIDNSNAQLNEYFLEEQTNWDKVMTELENGFNQDIGLFLETLSMEIYSNKLYSNKVTFKRLLSGNKHTFFDMGINLSPHCTLLTSALKTFHTRYWSIQSLNIKKDEMNVENIAQILAAIVRQLHILDASIIYLENNSYGLDPRKGQEALKLLNTIRITEDKIFEILDSKVRISQVDYVAPRKLRNRNRKRSIESIFFAGTAIALVLLRLI